MTKTPDQIRASSLIRGLAGFGDWWTALLLRDAFSGTRHFAIFQANLGIARQTLTNRLREMVENGIFYAKPYQARPVRYEYRLTAKGLGLYGYALMCWRWHRRWGDPARSSLPTTLMHRTCGHTFDALFGCAHCHDEVTIANVRLADGPGIRVAVDGPATRSKRHTVSRSILDDGNLYQHGAFVMTDRWSHAILAWTFLGHSTFDAFEGELGISPSTLAHRLKHLVEAQLLSRVPDSVDSRRVHYRLTARGLDLFPISVMLLQWADRWMPHPTGPTTLMFHSDCGRRLAPIAMCSACRQELNWWEVEADPSVIAQTAR